MPLVSVVMVAYKDSPFLIPAISSIFAQTFEDFEFVFVDNGFGFSDAQVGGFTSDERWRWVRRELHEGIIGGHNAGVSASTGKYIAIMDSDDLSAPERLARETAYLNDHPEVALVSGYAERIDETDRKLGRLEFCIESPSEQFAYSPFAGVVVNPLCLARRELYQLYPYRAPFTFAAELDFQARALETHLFAIIPEVLLRYRWYASQTTQTHGLSIERSRCAVQILSFRRRAGRPEDLSDVVQGVEAGTMEKTWRRAAMISIADGFPLLASYHVRRSIVHNRSIGNLLWALLVMLRILGTARKEHWRVLTMFLKGPICALDLHPVT